MELSFGHIELFVKDPLSVKDFYTDILKFELEEIQQDKFVWLKKGSFTILLRPGNPPEAAPNYQSARKAFVLYTNDLDKTGAELLERGLMFKGTDGSDRCLTFSDPEGNWFQLVNPNEH